MLPPADNKAAIGLYFLAMDEQESTVPHQRRIRYDGTHPRRFGDKYKELNPDKYAADVEKVVARGMTPAGMHRSICVEEILAVLHPAPGEIGLDATLGFGGHTRELLERIRPDGHVWATDVDPLELPRTTERLRAAGFGPSLLTTRHLNFAGLHKLLPELPGGGFDFILADLGVSSMQIDNPRRGFTFKSEGPLDLRLNPTRGKTAAELLATISIEALEKILRFNSDEPYAYPLARALCEQRGSIQTTLHLAEAITRALPPGIAEDKDARTKTLQRSFQALRIAVNDEFSALDQFLRTLPLALKPAGRVAILTFHSGEDKRVADSFAQGLAAGMYSESDPEPIRPGAQERHDNPRSKSARLRWAIRAFWNA